jgi:hypothetical protein
MHVDLGNVHVRESSGTQCFGTGYEIDWVNEEGAAGANGLDSTNEDGENVSGQHLYGIYLAAVRNDQALQRG